MHYKSKKYDRTNWNNMESPIKPFFLGGIPIAKNTTHHHHTSMYTGDTKASKMNLPYSFLVGFIIVVFLQLINKTNKMVHTIRLGVGVCAYFGILHFF